MIQYIFFHMLQQSVAVCVVKGLIQSMNLRAGDRDIWGTERFKDSTPYLPNPPTLPPFTFPVTITPPAVICLPATILPPVAVSRLTDRQLTLTLLLKSLHMTVNVPNSPSCWQTLAL